MEKETLIKTIKSEIKDVKNLHFFIWGILALLGISAAVYLGGGLIYTIPSILVGVVGHKISISIATKKLRQELSETIAKTEIKSEVNPQLNSKVEVLDDPSVVVEKKVSIVPVQAKSTDTPSLEQQSDADILEEVARRR